MNDIVLVLQFHFSIHWESIPRWCGVANSMHLLLLSYKNSFDVLRLYRNRLWVWEARGSRTGAEDRFMQCERVHPTTPGSPAGKGTFTSLTPMLIHRGIFFRDHDLKSRNGTYLRVLRYIVVWYLEIHTLFTIIWCLFGAFGWAVNRWPASRMN